MSGCKHRFERGEFLGGSCLLKEGHEGFHVCSPMRSATCHICGTWSAVHSSICSAHGVPEDWLKVRALLDEESNKAFVAGVDEAIDQAAKAINDLAVKLKDRSNCTCGSGGHPRECIRHPLAKELHATEISLDNVRADLEILIKAICGEGDFEVEEAIEIANKLRLRDVGSDEWKMDE